MPVEQISSSSSSVARPLQPWWQAVLPFAPLAFFILDIGWAIVGVIMHMYGDGNYVSDPELIHQQTQLMSLPAVAGTIVAVYVLLSRMARGWVQWTFLVVGSILCGFFSIQFWGALFR